MEFGSKYVYRYSNSSEEEVSEGEYETGYTDCVPDDLALTARSGQVSSKQNDEDNSSDEDDDVVNRYAKAKTYSVKRKIPRPPKPSRLHHWMQKSAMKPKEGPPALLAGDAWMSHAADGAEVGSSSSQTPLQLPAPLVARAPVAKKWRRADTNVVAIKFDHLTAPSNMHTGDPVFCKSCQAILSHISKLTKHEDNQVWICEYCGCCNPVDLMPEEIPSQSDVTFMMEPAPSITASGRAGTDESLVLFCVDISGSMCVSKEVPGTVRLKGNHADRFRCLNTDGENQWIGGQRRDVTYITRLQGLQAAIDNQLNELLKNHPNRHVALVTFNNDVTVVGDGSGIPVTITGDKLNNKEELIKAGSQISLPSSISSSRNTLGKKIFELEEGGQTALGPALLVSVMIACQFSGSRVIICTDGMANIGLGTLDNLTAEEFESSSVFYQEVADIAKSKGVSVSVLTIAGTECKLVELGRVASNTGGQVNTVDPMKLTKEFGNILADPIIATNVVATFLVHKGLYIRHEPERSSRAVKEVGNVTMESEITFEYGMRVESAEKAKDAEEPAHSGNGDAGKGGIGSKEPVAEAAKNVLELTSEDPQELPFQVQILYVDMEGAKAMRVLTQTKPVTSERHQAEMYMNMPILGCHALHQSSSMAVEGDYTPSRLNAYMYQRLLYRNIDDSEKLACYCAYNARSAPISDGILEVQQREASARGRTVTELDLEEERQTEDEETPKPSLSGRISKFFKGPSKAKAQRRMNCPDGVAQQAYRSKSSSHALANPPE